MRIFFTHSINVNIIKYSVLIKNNRETSHDWLVRILRTRLCTMVLILDGNPEHVTHAWRKIGLFGEKYPICKCYRSNEMPSLTDQTQRLFVQTWWLSHHLIYSTLVCKNTVIERQPTVATHNLHRTISPGFTPAKGAERHFGGLYRIRRPLAGSEPHGIYIRWKLRICCARMKENRSFRRKKNPICDYSQTNWML